MRAETITRLIAGAACLVLLGSSAGVAMVLNASAARHRLTTTDVAEEGMTPAVSLGIAMGAFRGVFVNVLWIRANELKEAGRYHEAMDLASAITRLQPRFPQVWAFHAWNMAYNISVTTQTLPERWEWVQSGIRLLRDQGIPANPNNLQIHKELAWIYLHKIQGYTDDANPYYKRQVAAEWTIVLGPPPPPNPESRYRDAAIRQFAQWLTPIAEAPGTLAGVIEREPTVAELARRLREECGLDPSPPRARDLREGVLRLHEATRTLLLSGLRTKVEPEMSPRWKAMLALVEDASMQRAWEAYLPMARRRVLEGEYRMEPARMIRYTREYGPLDWRHPAAHALYWSARGSERAWPFQSLINKRDFDFINTDRVTIQAIQELWRSGEVYFDFFAYTMAPDDATVFYSATPNAHFVESYADIIGTLVARSWADRDRVYSIYAAGYENFLTDAVRFFYRRGQIEEAQKWYHIGGTYPGQNLNDPMRVEDWSKPLDEFVHDELLDQHERPSVAVAEVTGALQAAYAQGLLAGDRELFLKQVEYARLTHQYYQQEMRRRTVVSPEVVRTELMPADFTDMAGVVFARFVATLLIDQAERVYDAAPPQLQVWAYDYLKSRFEEDMQTRLAQGGRSFDRVFPAPEGIEAHRAKLEARAERARRITPDVNVK